MTLHLSNLSLCLIIIHHKFKCSRENSAFEFTCDVLWPSICVRQVELWPLDGTLHCHCNFLWWGPLWAKRSAHTPPQLLTSQKQFDCTAFRYDSSINSDSLARTETQKTTSFVRRHADPQDLMHFFYTFVN